MVLGAWLVVGDRGGAVMWAIWLEAGGVGALRHSYGSSRSRLGEDIGNVDHSDQDVEMSMLGSSPSRRS